MCRVARLIILRNIYTITVGLIDVCFQAKAALSNYKINPEAFEWMEIEDREDCNEIQVEEGGRQLFC